MALGALGTVLFTIAGLAYAAYAAPPAMPGPFSFFTGGNAVAAWTNEEAQSGRFSVRLATNAPTGEAWAGVWVNGVSGAKLGDITALSFWVKGYTGAGSPRFSVVLTDGMVLWPSAYWCILSNHVENWTLVDFVNDPNCWIYDSWGHAHQGWGDVVAAHGDETVRNLFLIQDEGPAISYIDNITVGVGPSKATYGEPGDNGLPRRN